MYQIHHGDCLPLLQAIDPTTVALVLTDPPYGLGVDLRRQSKTQQTTTLINDHSQEAGQAVLDWAASHNIPTVAFASPKKPWAGEWRQYLVWDKGPAVGMGDLKRTFKPTWELIQMARNGHLRGRRDPAVLQYHVTPRIMRDHPTAKPVPLLRYLVEQLTDPGGLVIDPFMGVGSTGVACLETGRRFWGCELDSGYYAKAEARLAGVNSVNGHPTAVQFLHPAEIGLAHRLRARTLGQPPAQGGECVLSGRPLTPERLE